MSHHVDKVSESYFKNDISSIKKLYIDCVEALSIEDIDIQTLKSPEFIEIKNQLTKQEQINKEKDERLEKLEMALKVLQDIDKE